MNGCLGALLIWVGLAVCMVIGFWMGVHSGIVWGCDGTAKYIVFNCEHEHHSRGGS
jgi:hypothetical protein